MATSRSRIWGPELVPPAHGEAVPIQVTPVLLRRINRVLREWRRFKMPTRTEQGLLDKWRQEHIVRAATVSNGAFLGRAQAKQEWGR
jgi:hypothetical protein